jgi:hypothetical protein
MNAMLDRLWPRLAGGVLAFVFMVATPLIVALAPTVEAAGPSPSPSPSTSPTPASREQQDQYRAYVSMLTVDGSGVMAAVIELRSCHDSRDACRQALRQARAEVKAFESDLDRTPPPPCLHGADDQIRTSLGLYDRGLELVQEGTDNQERLKVIQGAILVLVATQKLGAAIRAVRRSGC